MGVNYFLGVDLGQSVDYTALARDDVSEDRGTRAALVTDREMAGRCTLVADATGVGQAVVDMLEWARLGCPLWKVKFRGGDGARCIDGHCRVPFSSELLGPCPAFGRLSLEL